MTTSTKEKIIDGLQFYFAEDNRLSGWIQYVQRMTNVYPCQKVKINGFVFQEGKSICYFHNPKGQFLNLEPPADEPEREWYAKLHGMFTYTQEDINFVWVIVRYLELTRGSHPITLSKYYTLENEPSPLLLSPQAIKAPAHFLHKKCFSPITSSGETCTYQDAARGFRRETNNYRKRFDIQHVTDPPEGNVWIHDQFYSKIVRKDSSDLYSTV